jgi:hypothetical protein
LELTAVEAAGRSFRESLDSGLVLELPRGLRILLSASFEAEVLRRVVAALL